MNKAILLYYIFRIYITITWSEVSRIRSDRLWAVAVVRKRDLDAGKTFRGSEGKTSKISFSLDALMYMVYKTIYRPYFMLDNKLLDLI